jgi:hypothetical protein
MGVFPPVHMQASIVDGVDREGKGREHKLDEGFGDVRSHLFAELDDAQAGAAIDGGGRFAMIHKVKNIPVRDLLRALEQDGFQSSIIPFF